MAHYLVQASYTSGSWAAQIKDPKNRIEQVEKMFAVKGIKFISGYYSFGEYDLSFIAEGPNNTSMASVLIAAGAGGAISKMYTTVLMTPEEGLEAIKAASSVEYRAPGS
jgi:uncharacterized protein with GYD domain